MGISVFFLLWRDMLRLHGLLFWRDFLVWRDLLLRRNLLRQHILLPPAQPSLARSPLPARPLRPTRPPPLARAGRTRRRTASEGGATKEGRRAGGPVDEAEEEGGQAGEAGRLVEDVVCGRDR